MASVAILSVIRAHAIDVTLVRRTAGTNARGYTTNSDSSSVIQAVIQPMTPKEMRNLPEGQDVLEANHIWSEIELRERDLVTNPEGIRFTIQGVEFWREGPFYHATALVQNAAR